MNPVNLKATHLTKSPSIIDLFSGCGGLSTGFMMEGITILTGIENNLHACKTASLNLHWKHGNDKEYLCEDITNVKASSIADKNSGPLITIGGPPCQAYSRIGKAKIKSLGEHRFGLNDNRAFLYEEFIRVGVELDSEAIIMENVPESVCFQGKNIPQTVCDILEEKGYNVVWTILNSADFGVPQTRERVFVIAIKKVYGEIKHLPLPTHSETNFSESKQRNKYKRFMLDKNFREPLRAREGAPKWVTVEEAISDLPGVFPSSNLKYPNIKLNTLLSYQTPPTNNYQFLMRGNKRIYNGTVNGNCFRNTKRDFRIFEDMGFGDDYRKAHKIAVEKFDDICSFLGVTKTCSPDKYYDLKKKYVPPYDLSKFHTRWKKLDPYKPSHTLVAHLGTDTYSHIHPYEPRGITVREAARLQSFPDSFIFNTSMGQAFKQIGNAVPPLLARGVAKAVKKNLGIKSD
ncbi:DNA cytosine methyltransferase [Guptibacillus sedimenti]|uniref:DNA cytosine methyltransferase n=1 Tax=Guptibacillus sedimenti TaxID=3025680 RepID=UPI00235F044C|nr:DNA cytosine methyltransferase [Pseudalkalibacillus sedimenti]